MFPKRKLLYHRGLDDSVGTYVTDYVYVVECFVLFGLLLYQFVKNRGVPEAKSGLSKSTVAVTIFLAASGVAALIGGLAHQYLQMVEPYTDHHDALHWVVLWRLGAALSGVVAFTLFMLTEYLISSEGLMRMNKKAKYGFYGVALLYSAGLVIHSFWMIFQKDPWSLTVTFVLLFIPVTVEVIVALVVLCKRFTTFFTIIGCDYSIAYEYDTFRSNTESYKSKTPQNLNGTNGKANGVSGKPNGETRPENANVLRQMKSFEMSISNESIPHVKRWDLFFHFLASLLLVIGGAIQLILAKFFKCGNHIDPSSQGCPLPNEFNHNSVFHIFQLFVAFSYFVAELYGIRHRKRVGQKLNSSL